MGKSVLIIEDDDNVAKAVAEVCATLDDVAAVTAKTGQQGLDKFKAQPFDVVMLDILLPGGMDGYKVAETLRGTTGGARVAIVVMSGFVKDPKAQKDLQTRFDVRSFLQKPLKPDDIRTALTNALGLSGARTSNPAIPALDAPAPIAKIGNFNVNLRHVSVATLFCELYRGKAEGVLDLTRENSKKRFYFQRGFFRYAASNAKAETVAGLLGQRGVPEARVNEAVQRSKDESTALTDVLLTMGLVTQKDLQTVLVAQTEEVAITALPWTDGKAAYKPQRVDSGPEGRANPAMCVLKGIKRLASPGDARAALAAQGTVVVERTPEFERELFAIRNLFAGEVITPAINGRSTIAELLPRCKDVDALLLHALLQSGLARAKGAAAFDFGELTSRPPSGGAPMLRANTLAPARPATSTRRHSVEEQASRERITDEAKRLQTAADHYQVLGVPPNADATTIKSAYFRLARTFHVDAYAGQELGDAIPALEEIFKKVSEANRVLSSEEERATYDLYLSNKSKGLPTSVDEVLQAEAAFGRGESARKQGRLKDAEKLYREAATLNAGEANYLFQLAAAITQLTPKTSQAEALDLLDKSIRIKQDLLPAILLRGQLLLEAGEPKQALELGRRILNIQAGYPGAMDLVRNAKAVVTNGPASTGEKSGGLLGKLFGGKGK